MVMIGFCGYGCYKLETEIEYKWLFPPDSYAVKFIDQRIAVCKLFFAKHNSTADDWYICVLLASVLSSYSTISLSTIVLDW